MGSFCSDTKANTIDTDARGRNPQETQLLSSDAVSHPDENESDDEMDLISVWETAIKDGNRDLIVSLLNESDDLLNHEFSNGDFAVHVCAQLKEKKEAVLINHLLEFGDDLSKKNSKNGNTALHYAVKAQNLKLVLFLRRKAPGIIEIRNNENELPYHIALRQANDDLIEATKPEEDEDGTLTEILNAGRPKVEPVQSIEVMITDESINLTQTKKPSTIDKIKNNTNYEESKQKEEMETPKKLAITKEKIQKPKAESKTVQVQNEKQNNNLVAIKPRNKFLKSQTSRKIMNNFDNYDKKNDELQGKEGWLEKYEKKKSFLTSVYSNRYVIVKKNYLLWSDKEKHINNIEDKKERAQFNRCFPFSVIQRCEPTITQANNKFQIYISRDPRSKKENQFTLKAKSKNERDIWVDVINQHIESIRTYESLLEG